MLLDGIIFGIIDNGVMILGALFGLNIEKYLPPYFHRGIGTVFGAGIANGISDLLGGLAVDYMFAVGTLTGCLLALVLIPVFVEYKKKYDSL